LSEQDLPEQDLPEQDLPEQDLPEKDLPEQDLATGLGNRTWQQDLAEKIIQGRRIQWVC